MSGSRDRGPSIDLGSVPRGDALPRNDQDGLDIVSPDPDLPRLLETIRACRLCRDRPLGLPLPHEPRPIFRISRTARLVIASQAPGARAHASGVPFNDPSGQRLRAWMGLDEATFYDESRVAIVPMGFCFPGHDALKGDLPPRPECRAAWHDRLFARLPQVETILAIGLFGIRYHTGRLRPAWPRPAALGETVAGWRRYADGTSPRILPLPHPSWRNSAWLKAHSWFETDVLPELRREVRRLVTPPGAFSPGSTAEG